MQRRSKPPPLNRQRALVGRATLVEEAELALQKHDVVVLLGLPGVGKTRILENIYERYSKGAFIDLEGAESFSEIEARWREAVGARPDETLGALLAEHAGRTFFVDHAEDVPLDSFIDRARQHGGRFVVASRTPLSVDRALECFVGQLDENDALELLEAVLDAAAIDSRALDRATLASLLERVDRLPLGIEIIGAWLKSFSPEALLRVFTLDLPSREAEKYASLEVALELVWHSLSEEEHGLLFALAPFRAGGTIEAIERATKRSSLRVLEALRRRSLGTFANGRFRLLHAVEDFARRKLESREDIDEVHLQWARSVLADFVDLRARRVARAVDLERLTLERKNLVAIAERFRERDVALFAEARLTLHPLVLRRGPIFERDDAGDRALARMDAEHPLARALLLARGEEARLRGSVIDAVAAAERVRGDSTDRIAMEAERLLAWASRSTGGWDDAETILERAREGAARLEDPLLQAQVLVDLGFVLLRRGKVDRARESFEHARDLFLDAGNDVEVGIVSSHLGVTLQRSGAAIRAREMHELALRIHEREGNERFIGAEHMHLGYIAIDLGEHDRAQTHFDTAIAYLSAVGERPLTTVVELGRVRLAIDRGRLEEAASSLERSERWLRAQSGREGSASYEATRLRGHLAALRGDFKNAVLTYESASQAQLHSELGIPAMYFRSYAAHRTGLIFNELPVDMPDRFNGTHALEQLGIELLRAATAGTQPPAVSGDQRARSFELRLVLELVASRKTGELILGGAGRWFSVEGHRVDLARRGAVRLILIALVHARQRGEVLTLDDLIVAGWPEERILADAAKQRAYSAIWTLRSLGLESWLVSDELGYRLREGLTVRETNES